MAKRGFSDIAFVVVALGALAIGGIFVLPRVLQVLSTLGIPAGIAAGAGETAAGIAKGAGLTAAGIAEGAGKTAAGISEAAMGGGKFLEDTLGGLNTFFRDLFGIKNAGAPEGARTEADRAHDVNKSAAGAATNEAGAYTGIKAETASRLQRIIAKSRILSGLSPSEVAIAAQAVESRGGKGLLEVINPVDRRTFEKQRFLARQRAAMMGVATT